MKATLEGLAVAAIVVAKGGLVCYPTDTVYGLGCDPLNSSGIERALRVKGGRTKSMPVLVKGLEDAERLSHVSKRARQVAQAFWPGPLTMVLPAREILPKILAPEGTVGLRSPRHAICRSLLGLCSGALVGTSANLTGQAPAISADQVVRELGESVDLILDGGAAPIGVSSTVVDLTTPKLRIIREGPIARVEIMRRLRASVR
jgi:L-threonylcarbamoyladenylate synthase